MILKTYCGYLNDNHQVRQSSSGGLATALTNKMILNEKVVYGVSYCCGFTEAKYIRIDNINQITLLKGSKYIKAPMTADILKMVSKDLKSQKTVLFIGLPCDVHILKAYLKKKHIPDDNLFCVDLICHGPTTPMVAKEYIAHLEKKYRSKITDFSVRYKNPFWTPPYLYAKFQNGKEFKKKFYETEYGLAFSLMPAHESCYRCSHKNKNYESDITIGDYWEIKPEDPGYNEYGTSIAFVHTEKGEHLLLSLDDFCLFDANCSQAIKGNPRYLIPVEPTVQSQIFRERFNKKGLFFAVSKHFGIKKYIPKKMIHILKRILRRTNVL